MAIKPRKHPQKREPIPAWKIEMLHNRDKVYDRFKRLYDRNRMPEDVNMFDVFNFYFDIEGQEAVRREMRL